MSRILTISSWVARGHVGNSATTFPLMRRGHEVVSLPTVVLAHHPGHAPLPARAEIADIAAMGRDTLGSPTPHPVDAILVGYLAQPVQAIAAAGIVAEARAMKSGVPLLLDPVAGDAGRLYVASQILEDIRTHLLPTADVVTPNVTELVALMDADRTDRAPGLADAEIVHLARGLGPPTVVVTSAPSRSPDAMANLVVTADNITRIETPRVDVHVHGTGDLMAGLILSGLVNGEHVVPATAAAAAIVHDVLETTRRLGRDEPALVEAQARFIRPHGRAQVSEL